MVDFPWNTFLDAWYTAILECPERSKDKIPDEIVSGGIKRPPASEEQIAAAEAQLGMTLPPSYKAFLRVTNGLPVIRYGAGRGGIEHLYVVADIGWHRDLDPDFEKILKYHSDEEPVPDNEYFVYGKNGANFDHYPYQYFSEVLEIGSADGGNILLNPAVQFEDGEWETWFMAFWIPGVYRYTSFAALMVNNFKAFLDTCYVSSTVYRPRLEPFQWVLDLENARLPVGYMPPQNPSNSKK